MNGLEQRQRHTAVASAERRIDDLETVLPALAGEIVKDREKADQDLAALTVRVVQLQTDVTELRLTAAASAKRLSGRIGRFEEMTFWQRLRWFATGR